MIENATNIINNIPKYQREKIIQLADTLIPKNLSCGGKLSIEIQTIEEKKLMTKWNSYEIQYNFALPPYYIENTKSTEEKNIPTSIDSNNDLSSIFK
jgi:hypothetical protein